jgi:hypothetical protein
MHRVHVSAVLDVPIGAAWAVLRDFNGLPGYHEFFATSHIEDGLPADRIGCVRNFRTHGGDVIRERLLTLCDREFRCGYTIIEVTGLPVADYVAELTLRRVTEGDRTFGEWWANFGAAPEHAADCIARVTDTFRLGFAGAERVARACP